MRNKFRLYISIILFQFLMGCSNVMDVFFAPFVSSFEVKIVRNGSRAEIDYNAYREFANSIGFNRSDAISRSKDEKKYDIFYAAYIFRSEKNPYEGYSLIARHYNNAATGRFQTIRHSVSNNQIIVNRTDEDFRLTVGRIENILNQAWQNENRFIDTGLVANRDYFYRVSVLVYSYSEVSVTLRVNDRDENRTDIIHRLGEYLSSGWGDGRARR